MRRAALVVLALASCFAAKKPSSTTISQATGGTALSADGNLVVSVPPGALSGDANLVIAEVSPSPEPAATLSKVYRVTLDPPSVTVAQLQVAFSLDPRRVTSVGPENLAVGTRTGESGPFSELLPAAWGDALVATAGHTGDFAALDVRALGGAGAPDAGVPSGGNPDGGPTVCVPRCAGKECGDDGCGGYCGTCATGWLCSSGTCQPNCPFGSSICGGDHCADLANEVQNCGSCGHACSDYGLSWFTPTCQSGVCSEPCPGQTLCGYYCTDTSDDVNNCGYCGHVCPSAAGATPVCQGGACGSPQCGYGETLCSDGCHDLASDEANCGSCGHSCAAFASGVAASGATLLDKNNYGETVEPGRCAAGTCEVEVLSTTPDSCRSVCGRYGLSCPAPAFNHYGCYTADKYYLEGTNCDGQFEVPPTNVGCDAYLAGPYGAGFYYNAYGKFDSCDSVPVASRVEWDPCVSVQRTYSFNAMWCVCD